MKARCQRCAPAAATIRFLARSSRLVSSCRSAASRRQALRHWLLALKTPTYFLGASHGFNSVHGRMPSVLTGANLANRDLIYIGVSGDGDTASMASANSRIAFGAV